MKTTNGGINWIQHTTGFSYTLEKVFFSSTNTGYVIGEGGIILKTTTQGLSWIQHNSGTTHYLKSISFIDDSIGYIAGLNNTVLKTTNGGINWNNVFIDDSLEFFSIYFVNELTGWVSSRKDPFPFPPSPALRIYKTTNGATNWFLQYERPIEHTPLLSLNFVNPSHGWTFVQFGAVAACEIVRTTNGGTNWSSFIIGPNEYHSIYFINERKGWAVGDYNGLSSPGIKIITNGGLDWMNQPNNPAGYLHSVYFIDSLTGWATGEDGVILKTTTGGVLTNFTNLTSEIPDNYSLSQNFPNPFNPKTIISYSIPSNVKRQTSNVKLIVFNNLGKEVNVLVNESKPAGVYEVEFDGSNLSSGIYFYRLEVDGNVIDTKRMVLLK